MKSKKGVIEVQFNWMFILIIGAIILLFFVLLVQKQKSVSETGIKAKISTNLKTIFTGSKVAARTAHMVEIPGSDINYDCQGFGVGEIQRFKTGVSFAPSLIKQGNIMLWALEWEMPYKITNFLYATSPEVRYVLVYDSSEPNSKNLAFEINKTLPDRHYKRQDTGVMELMLNKELINVSDYNMQVQEGRFRDMNNYKVRFIIFNIPIENFQLPSEVFDRKIEWSVLEVEGNENNGNLYFHGKKGNLGETAYLGKELLIGAVFADEFETYNCNMQAAFRKMELITEIYIKRTETLSNRFNQEYQWSNCKSYASLVNNNLIDIKDRSETIITDLEDDEDISFNVGLIFGAAASIETQNNMIGGISCPIIY